MTEGQNKRKSKMINKSKFLEGKNKYYRVERVEREKSKEEKETYGRKRTNSMARTSK